MNVYQASDRRWLVYNNGLKSAYFNTEAEAIAMSEKIKFAEEVQASAEELSVFLEGLPKFVGIRGARKYDDTNPITDDDITSTGNKAAEIDAYIILADALVTFIDSNVMNDGETTTYRIILDILRTDA